MKPDTRRWIEQDKNHAWHPFTRQDLWCEPEHDPLVLVGGEGAWLIDSDGGRYLDANSSIWTNIHGHAHPKLTEAIQSQAAKVAHTSYLGFSNPVASELAERLSGFFPAGTLDRVFFSDNGSTAIEVALKLSIQYRQLVGEENRTGFVSFSGAYHGDTLGAASLGGVSRFFDRFEGLGFLVHRVPTLEALLSLTDDEVEQVTAIVIEPMIQGVNHMTPWPAGMLWSLREWCDSKGVHLILDEVMTGFGRTGKMFACEHESVIPDFLCLAKGLTGGCVPLAATLVQEAIYEVFRGSDDAVFYYGHSYTANQIGCAAALASLDVFEEENVLESLPEKIALFEQGLETLDVEVTRSLGLIAGVDLSDEQESGAAFCLRLRSHAILTRPILNTVVLMPPLCISHEDIGLIFEGLRVALRAESR